MARSRELSKIFSSDTLVSLDNEIQSKFIAQAIEGQTANLLELRNSSGSVVSSIGPTGALGGTIGNSGLVHIETVTHTSVASFSLPDNTFTSDFDNYLILLNLDIASNVNATFRYRASGSDNSTSNYFEQLTIAGGSNITTGRNSSLTANRLGFLAGSEPNIVRLEVYNPNLAKKTATLITNQSIGSGVINEYIGTNFNTTAVFDSMSFLFGATTSTGKAHIYGYKK